MDNEVVVKVEATGICGSDIPRIYHTGAYTHPLIPGHEFSGKVIEVGKMSDKKWINKRVGIYPLIPCNSCISCKKKQYEMCKNYSYLGSRRDGGFAEYVAVPERNLIELPETVSYEEAAMLEPMSVAAHAMRRINPNRQDVAVVYGLGTIGLLLLMFLREAGIEKILVIGNKDIQKQCVLRMGMDITNYCDTKNQDVGSWLMEKTEGKGADILFECIGRNEIVVQAIDFTAPAGRIMLVGNPYSDMNIEKQVYWKILRKQLTVMGTWNSSFTGEKQDDWYYVLERLEKKLVNPVDLISHRFSLAKLEKGFHIMRDKSEDYVKILGLIN